MHVFNYYKIVFYIYTEFELYIEKSFNKSNTTKMYKHLNCINIYNYKLRHNNITVKVDVIEINIFHVV